MPTVAFPADQLTRRGPSSITWGLQSSTLTHTSPLSGSIRTLSTPGARWRFTATWPALKPVYDAISTIPAPISDRAVIEAFLASLNGRAGRFTFYPPESVTVQNGLRVNTTFISQATVNGAGQTGTFLLCTATHPSVAWQGVFFSVNGELKRITQSTATDVSGNITLAFSPPLRSSPPNGAAVSFVKPLGTFMLVDDYAGLTVGPGGYADFTLDAIEAFL
jgi:hypothetical protein